MSIIHWLTGDFKIFNLGMTRTIHIDTYRLTASDNSGSTVHCWTICCCCSVVLGTTRAKPLLLLLLFPGDL